jgi:hypothetical protein
MGQFRIDARYNYQGQLGMNSFWYINPDLPAPTQTDIDSIHTSWTAKVQPAIIAFSNTGVQLVEVTVQGYTAGWLRSPYLSTVYAKNLAGTRAGAGIPPAYVAVLGMRVEPASDANRPGGAADSPVRRGYLAFSGLIATDVDGSGNVTAAARSLAVFLNLRTAGIAALDLGASLNVCAPIRVSQPVEPDPRRGYGYVRDAAWRAAASTRRSRKVGIGQ